MRCSMPRRSSTRRSCTGRIIEFKVMLRPLKAINLVHQRMTALLQAKP